MPMTLTINRNRKTSHNYNSEGYGVSLSVELDQGLLSEPDALQQEISRLYDEAETALEHQVNGHSNCSHIHRQAPATQAQHRAIEAIAREIGVDPATEAKQRFGWNLEQINIRQASQMIDHLKRQSSAGI